MLSLREYMILESCNYDYILEALGGAEIRKNLDISEISAKEVEKLITSKEYGGGKQFDIDDVDEMWAFNDVTHYAFKYKEYGGGKQFDIDDVDDIANEIWAFNEVTHYAFKYKGDVLAIIGVKNFYDILKAQKDLDDIIALILFVIPLLVLNNISLENISLQYMFNTIRRFDKSEDETSKKMYDLMKKSLYVCELQINKETIKKHDLSIIAPIMIVFDWVKKYSNDNWILCAGKDERTANMYKKVGKFWNITLNDKYSKKISEYVKNWSEKDYNSKPEKNRYSADEINLQYFEESIKLVCILKK